MIKMQKDFFLNTHIMSARKEVKGQPSEGNGVNEASVLKITVKLGNSKRQPCSQQEEGYMYE